MSPIPAGPRGMYFDEFQPGLKIATAGRTVTESDIVSFAGLSGDFNQIHVDAEYSRVSPAGQRVAHGLLVLAMVSGLAVQTGMMEGTIIYFREVAEWKFVKPVLIGDTIHAIVEVKEVKDMRRIGAGSVSMEIEVRNQREEVVQRGLWNVLVALRPE
ncbi:MAG: MaoC family dehydratase N-terminal domain-containing protein [Anaerolineales bacterium]|nr:MaoC family dehydratase N-terminal domain-containing protein [Anaerolineales bacterium]